MKFDNNFKENGDKLNIILIDVYNTSSTFVCLCLYVYEKIGSKAQFLKYITYIFSVKH